MIDSLSMNMKFWHDGQNDSTRLRNVEFCWPKLKDLAQLVRTQTNMEVKESLFDFSVDKQIDDAIHIPYPLGTYKVSEKTNLMLNYQKQYSMFLMMDSDAFFDTRDYDKFIETITNMSATDIITFDLAKLDKVEHCINDNVFNRDLADWTYAYAGDKDNGPLCGRMGGLGGVYILNPTDALSIGGFNEQYVGWGGEDGDMLDRLLKNRNFSDLKPQRHFAPFHLPHFSDFANPLYANRF